MGNQDLEHALNPWMYDTSGNLTASARQQFPDSAAAPVITTGASVSASASGSTLVVHPQTLKAAGQNATDLGRRMETACQTPVGDDLFTAAAALTGWATGGALTTAHSVWENQFLSLSGTMIQIGQNLQDTAAGYTGVETTNHGRMRALES